MRKNTSMTAPLKIELQAVGGELTKSLFHSQIFRSAGWEWSVQVVHACNSLEKVLFPYRHICSVCLNVHTLREKNWRPTGSWLSKSESWTLPRYFASCHSYITMASCPREALSKETRTKFSVNSSRIYVRLPFIYADGPPHIPLHIWRE